MVTTFKDPEIVNDGVIALFTANGSWQKIFDYQPAPEDILRYTPALIVLQRGTLQESNNLNTNPTNLRFLVFSMVLANDDATAGTTSAEAEAKRRELDRTYRQIIRNNMGGGGFCDGLIFGGRSTVDDRIPGGLPYIVDAFEFFAILASGA